MNLDRTRTLSLLLTTAIAALAGLATTGCVACPSVYYADSVNIDVDTGYVEGEVWELTITPEGEPPCTVVFDEGGPFLDLGPTCPGFGGMSPWLDVQPGAERTRIMLPDWLVDSARYALRIDGVMVGQTAARSDWESRYPDGPFCGEALDAEIPLAVERL